MKLIERKNLATDVIAHDVSPLTVHTDPRAYSRLGWFIVLFGVLGFLIWACFAPLDKGVPLSGTVAKEFNRKSIQHLTGGTVEDILVKEGDIVKKGQTLVRMNAVQVKSQVQVSRAQYFSVRAAEARLIAERDGKSAVAYPAALLPYKDEMQVKQAVELQNALFTSRVMGLKNELGALDEQVAGLQAQISGVEISRDSKKQQLVIIKEQLDNLHDLAGDGYVPRSKLLDAQRMYMQMQGTLAEDIGTLGHAHRQIAEIGLRKAQRKDEYQKEVRTQLSDMSKEAEALAGRMTSEDYAVANSDVKSPVDGIVMGMNVFTRGGVVGPGFRMMDIVPTGDALVIEGRLPVNLVDKVHVGLKTELIFSAFNTNTTPHIPGVITDVSADRLLDEHNGTPYYSVLAKVSPEGLKMIQAKKLDVRPGMPVELFVQTGSRSMMSYLLKPVFDRAKTSLSEE